MVTVGDRKKPRGDGGVDCGEEHDDLMTKMTIRMIVIMAGAVTIVGGFMVWVAAGQVTGHVAEKHQALLPQQEIDAKLMATEERLEDKIDEVKDDLQGDIESIQDGQIRMENKLDHLMEVLLDHDRSPGQ